MKNKFLKKLGIVVLSGAIICGTTSASQVCVYAEDMQDIQDTKVVADGNREEEDGGAEYDLSGQGSVSGVEATNEALVTVDSVEVTDTKSSDEEATGRYLLDVIKTENSEVIVEGDVDVTTQGTVGTQVTSVVNAENSKATINGDIKVDDNVTFTRNKEFSNESSVIGIEGLNSTIDVGGDVDISSKNARVTGAQLWGDGTANISGSISVSTENCTEGSVGAFVAGPILVIDGDVNVNGGYMGIGLDMHYDSKAYIKGNVTVESAEQACGIDIHNDAVAVIDGVLAVKATNSAELNCLAIPYNPYEAENAPGDSCIYVYKFVDETNYSDDDISREVLHDEALSFPRLKYIIRTDEGLTTNANTFSDDELGISEFFYSSEGETITVSSNGRTIYGIKNEDSSIDIKVRDNGNGTWTIIVPKGGGVHLQAILERVEEVIENNPSEINGPTEDERDITTPNTNTEVVVTPPNTDTGIVVTPSNTELESEPKHSNTDGESNSTTSNTDVVSHIQVTQPKAPVVIEAVAMTQTQISESVTGSVEYLAKQAEIESTMMQALNIIDTMSVEQVENLKATGFSIDAGGCLVADAKVSQLVLRALNKGIPMNISFRANGVLVKFTIPAGFDVSLFINADGTIDFMKLFSAIQGR